MSKSQFNSNPIVSPPFSFSKPSSASFGVCTTSSDNNISGAKGIESPVMSPPLSRTLYNYNNNNNANINQSTNRIVPNANQAPTSSLSSLSRALSCQSPDSQSIHSLIQNHSIIQTQILPLSSSSSSSTSNNIIETQLPSWLVSSLQRIDPPNELLCIDNDITITSSLLKIINTEHCDYNFNGESTRKVYLPLLCIYTSKSIYIIKIYITSSQSSCNKGIIESIHEPIESYIHSLQRDSSYNYQIQRVRSASCSSSLLSPTNTTQNHFFIPCGCLAILVSLQKRKYHQTYSTTTYKLDINTLFDDDSDDDNEDEMYHSKLILYHGIDNDSFYHSNDKNGNRSDNGISFGIDTPLSSKESHNNLTIMDVNTFASPLIDFTFLKPTNVSPSTTSSTTTSSSILWNGMTILLSTTNSEIYTMSPIVFHNMALSKYLLEDGLYYLNQHGTNNTAISSTRTNGEKDNESNDYNISIHSNINGVHGDDKERKQKNEIFSRRNKAASVFIKDVFGITTTTTNTTSLIKNTSLATLTENKKRTKNNNQPFIVTANILNHTKKECNASSWPITMQGPIYKPLDLCMHEVVSMESLPSISLPSSSSSFAAALPSSNNDSNNETATTSCGCLSGYTTTIVLACGKDGQCVQYIMIPSGINFIPRFAFESEDDCQYLNELIDNTGMLVEDIVLDDDDDDETNEGQEKEEENILYIKKKTKCSGGKRNVMIHIDPIDNSMIHHFSKYGVVTITTNCHRVMLNQLKDIVEKKSSENRGHIQEVKTLAWSTIDILQGVDHPSNGSYGCEEHVVGINVCGDAKIGHILVAVLANGKAEAINLTAAQYLNEANNTDESCTDIVVKTDEEKEVDEALKMIEEIPPLQEEINPLLEKISQGLSGMSKIIGAATNPHDITPGMLATFLSMKMSNEENMIVHLRELHFLVTSRLPYLHSIRDHQNLQLSRLNEMIRNLEERVSVSNERRVAIESNFKFLSQRSANVLCTARELTPTITEAERDYFKDIQRYDNDCEKLEVKLNEIRTQCKQLKDSVDSIQADMGASQEVELSKEHLDMCYALLEGKKQKMEESKDIIQNSRNQLNKILINRSLRG